MVSSVENASGHGCVSQIGCGYRTHCRILWLPLTLLMFCLCFGVLKQVPGAVTQQHNLGCPVPHLLAGGSYPRILLPSGTAAPWPLAGMLWAPGAAAASAAHWWLSLTIQPSRGSGCPLCVCSLCARGHCVQSPAKAHQTEMLCSRTRMQQFCSHLATSPLWFPPWGKQLLCRLRACPDPGWGGSWEHNWELSNASAPPVQTQSTQQENICLQGVLCRACDAWITFVCSYAAKGMDPNPAQSRVSAAFSSGGVHCPWVQLLPILCSRDGRGAAAQSPGTCVGLCAWAVPWVWRLWPWCVCLSLVLWEGQEGSSDTSADICLLFRKNNWCLGKFLFLRI